MPWKDATVVDQRRALVEDWLSGRHTLTALADAHGVSRKTAHKWVKRFKERGWEGLEDRSRAPINRPSKTSSGVADLVLACRRRYPRWGAPKIQAKLAEDRPDLEIPCPRTVHSILVAAGLVAKRRRPRRPPRRPKVALTQSKEPNDVWTLDFKGDFLLGNGRRCCPLTVCDHQSRYLLACYAQSTEQERVTRRNLQRVFEEFGLPRVIRSDNGRPFGSQGVLGLSRLSVWLLKLGIRPEHTQPSRPDQNGRHERMHRELKAEAASPPKRNLKAQQRAFDDFSDHFNRVRPHAALDQTPPARVYSPSERPFPAKVRGPEYPAHFKKRSVLKDGDISWRSHRIRVGGAFRGEYLGLEEVADGLWVVHFGPLELGLINDRALDDGVMIHRTPELGLSL